MDSAAAALLVASGDGWQTTFVLVNLYSVATPLELNFFADDGSPLTLPISYPQTGVTYAAPAKIVSLAWLTTRFC